MFTAWILLMMNSLFFSLRLGSSGSFPRPLRAEEERDCLERAAKGDLEARNKLIEHNLRLVAHIIKKYYTQAGDQDDLISIGTIGLIKGISTFNPDKKVRLATYASRCVENAILSQRLPIRKARTVSIRAFLVVLISAAQKDQLFLPGEGEALYVCDDGFSMNLRDTAR